MDQNSPAAGQLDAADGPTDALTVLVTGFGPFPGVDDNPSGRFARAVDGRVIDGVSVVGCVLPVEWRRAWPAIVAAVEAHRPVALLMYGVATRRAQVEVERIARNTTGRQVDAAGELPLDPRIVAGAPGELTTTLPWRDLVGPDVGSSLDAGDYLCNYVMYRSVHELCDRVRHCGFVHLPPHETPGAMAVLTRLVAALR